MGDTEVAEVAMMIGVDMVEGDMAEGVAEVVMMIVVDMVEGVVVMGVVIMMVMEVGMVMMIVVVMVVDMIEAIELFTFIIYEAKFIHPLMFTNLMSFYMKLIVNRTFSPVYFSFWMYSS